MQITGDGLIIGLQAGGLPDASVVPADLAQKLTLGTAQATTSGTAIDFTGIPSWVKRITVALNGVSTNGSTTLRIQIGSGSIETSGYLGYASRQAAAANSYAASTSGFDIGPNAAATDQRTGLITLVHMGSNLWIGSGVTTSTNATNLSATFAGSKTTSGVLDRLRLTSATPDTFDGGSVNILYEG